MTDRSVSFTTEPHQEAEELFFRQVYGDSFRFHSLTASKREQAWRDLLDHLEWKERAIVRHKFGLGLGNGFCHTEDALLSKVFKLPTPEIKRILETALTKVRRAATTWSEGDLPQAV